MIAIVETTFSSEQEALDAAVLLVEERLCACAQVGAPLQSIYHWEGEMTRAQEFPVRFKTARAAADTLIARLKTVHPYEVPEILLQYTEADTAYAAWAHSSILIKEKG